MKRYLLYGYGGAYNHGAEAIVRTTISLLRQHGGQILLSTHFPEQDKEFGVDQLVDKLIPADLSLVTQERSAVTWEEKETYAKLMYRNALAEINSDTVCVGIGGDNYCYPNWYRQSVFHKVAKERGAVSILWGCSIQPEMIDSQMEQILQQHDHIYARESETQKALLEYGITQVSLILDPAFALPPQPVQFPPNFCPGRTVAMNLSPLVLRRTEGLMDYFVQTAHQLLQNGQDLLFLPHVIMSADDDRVALSALKERLSPEEQKRICCLHGSLNAAQLKYLISKCEMLICSRTHASIAGYSSCVPTLVMGYSVKSVGIGQDLNMKNWVIPLEESAELPKKAMQLWNERAKVREILNRSICLQAIDAHADKKEQLDRG